MKPSDSDSWRTPQALFDKLNEEYYFVLDAAATAENTKCKEFYTQSLDKDWSTEGWIWCNPPYSRGNIDKFADKFIEAYRNGSKIVALVRLDPGAKWFRKLIKHAYAEVIFLDKRLKFMGAPSSYPFPCCLLIMNGDLPQFSNAIYCEVP